jgi:hypothetical protein
MPTATAAVDSAVAVVIGMTVITRVPSHSTEASNSVDVVGVVVVMQCAIIIIARLKREICIPADSCLSVWKPIQDCLKFPN